MRRVVCAVAALVGAAAAHGKEPILVWALSRHSIKSVNYTAELGDLSTEVRYAPPTSHPVHGGDKLTEHGKAYARRVGQEYREVYQHAFPAGMQCEEVARRLTMWSDTDVRDVESAELFLEGFAEGCAGTRSWVVADAWTHELMEEQPHGYPACEYATEAEVVALYGGDIRMWLETNFAEELQALTDHLAPASGHFKASGQGCPADAKTRCTFLTMAEKWVGPGSWATYQAGWQRAGQLAVTLVQQFVNNMTYSDDPKSYVPQMAPGELARLYAVGDASFGLYKNPVNGRLFGNNLQAQLLRDVRQAVDGHKSVDGGASRPPQLKYLMAHDVNVKWLADALRLSLNTPGWRQGTSSIFMGAIVVEVNAEDHGAYSVSAYQQASTMQQIRGLGGMVRSPVPLPCLNPFRCDLAEFTRVLANAIHPQCVAPAFRQEVAEAQHGATAGCFSPTDAPDPQPAKEHIVIVEPRP